MAARYVNPDNVTAQGQYFYTGLLPGSYDTGGTGGGNVYGAGSGGSAGVAADRTGSDSKKTWAYQSHWKFSGKPDTDKHKKAVREYWIRLVRLFIFRLSIFTMLTLLVAALVRGVQD